MKYVATVGRTRTFRTKMSPPSHVLPVLSDLLVCWPRKCVKTEIQSMKSTLPTSSVT